MGKITEILSHLSHQLFRNLTTEELNQIATIAELKYYKKGDILIHEGEESLFVYIIIDGTVSVTRKDETLKKVIELATLGPKSLVGEISVITRKPKTATITALVDVDALQIDFSKIETLDNSHQIYAKLLGNLADEMAKKLVFAPEKQIVANAEEEYVFDERYTEVPNSILLLFGWKWKDIIYEIPFLAAHGYDAIKVFPPQEFAVLDDHPWYEIYQPVSYKLSSFYGAEEDFVAMVDIAHTYGIKVYVDLVMNHMAEFPLHKTECVGTNGTKFEKYHYGPLNSDDDFYEYDDFYHFGGEENKVIEMEDYSAFDKSWRVEHFDLNYLPKLNFYKSHVIEVLKKYVNHLLYLGVDGFRIDAAKHISADALAKILQGLKTRTGLNPFIYLEYYANFPAGIDPYSFMDKYFKIGYVTAFTYGDYLTDAINSKNNNLENLIRYSFGSSWVHFPENRTIVLLDNHDTERAMPHILNYKCSDNNAYVLAYIFMLAWPFGIPKIMSSFRFNGFNDPIPPTQIWQDGRNTCFDGDSPWVCQHRWRAVSNMVLFRKKMQDAKGISHVWANKNQVAFARTYQKPKEYVATAGFVVINNSSEKLQHRFETGLPAGKYFNIVICDLVEGKMIGPTIKVEDYGFADIVVDPYDAVVIGIDFAE
jgi:alpha-amylase